jgi:NADH-quinone oxidoreductase subunit H
MIFFIIYTLKYLTLLIAVLLMVAFYTVFERKIIGTTQRRAGPAIVGLFGLLQAVADGLKLLLKTNIQVSFANKFLFVICPLFVFFLSLVSWSIVPLGFNIHFIQIKFNLLLLLALSSLNAYGVILAGWASNSKYALIGALRAGAQMIAYEISFSLMLLNIIVCVGSLNLISIVAAQAYCWFCVQHFPIFIIFFLTILAETNRHPFDFAEAESELVSGFNIEYGSMNFALFFLGEYSNMILMSVLTSLMFLGGWNLPFITHLLPPMIQSIVLGTKTLFIMALIVLARASFPRLRYDTLMNLGWKTFLPFNLAWFILTCSLLLIFDGLPTYGGYPEKYCYFSMGDLYIYTGHN